MSYRYQIVDCEVPLGICTVTGKKCIVYDSEDKVLLYTRARNTEQALDKAKEELKGRYIPLQGIISDEDLK